MDQLTFANPVFSTYAVAAALMVLKAVAMSWLTVVRMMQVGGGYVSPEDARRTPLNPNPRAGQTDPDERVERIRRIHRNDLENLPFFFMAGGLYVLTSPPLLLAQVLFYGYVVSRLVHFAAYFTAQVHDVRATLWTIGSLILIYMTGASLLFAIGMRF